MVSSSFIESDYSSESDKNKPNLNQDIHPLISVEKEDSFRTDVSEQKDISIFQEVPVPLVFGEFTNWKPVKMQKVSDFVFELHKKYYNYTAPTYEESEFNYILDEMNKRNLEKPKEERMYFKRDQIH